MRGVHQSLGSLAVDTRQTDVEARGHDSLLVKADIP
jgi:hypothetical protein